MCLKASVTIYYIRASVTMYYMRASVTIYYVIIESESESPRAIQSMEFSSQNNGMSGLSLLQEIFPT